MFSCSPAGQNISLSQSWAMMKSRSQQSLWLRSTSADKMGRARWRTEAKPKSPVKKNLLASGLQSTCSNLLMIFIVVSFISQVDRRINHVFTLKQEWAQYSYIWVQKGNKLPSGKGLFMPAGAMSSRKNGANRNQRPGPTPSQLQKLAFSKEF